MRIKHLKIENFRAVKVFDEEIGPYTAFIGYNGAGKSTILNALRWFFDGYELKLSDVYNGETSLEEKTVTVTVTFSELSPQDKINFGPYANSDEVTLIRKGSIGNTSKLYGLRMVYPLFSKIRSATSISDKRQIAIELINEHEHLSALGINSKSTKDQIDSALSSWEAAPENAEFLEAINDEAANNYFGAVGTDKLKIDSGFVFIPAAPDLTGEFDLENKGAAIQVLLGDILKGAVKSSIETWKSVHSETLNDLERAVSNASSAALIERASHVNRHLSRYLPGHTLEFKVSITDLIPKTTPAAQSILRNGNRELFVESEGHGTQRATLLSLLQAAADAKSAEYRNIKANEHSDEGTSNGRETLIVCIEEPEVYQHPVQARLMASSFIKASAEKHVQFIIATHSPYFLSPTNIEHTFRVEYSRNGAVALRASQDTINKLGSARGEIDKYFGKMLIEGLFSRLVVIVEGDTDKAILENISHSTENFNLASLGVTVASADGSNNLIKLAKLFLSFGVPVFIIRDGDSDRSLAKDESKLKSWKSGVETFLQLLAESGLREGLEDFTWGSGERIGTNCAILDHDLESLLNQWNSYLKCANEHKMPTNLQNPKQAGVVARVVSKAETSDMPIFLNEVLEAIKNLATNQTI